MELIKLEDSKNKLKLEIKGEDHTLLNAIRKELWEDKDVEVAGYRIDHILIGSPILIVEGKNPKKSILNACDRLKKENKEFRDKVVKAVA